MTYKIPLKISYLYPVSNGPDDVQMEKEEFEFDNVDDAVLFLNGLEEEMEKREVVEETLCGKPHNNGDNSPEGCGGECMAIKLGI